MIISVRRRLLMMKMMHDYFLLVICGFVILLQVYFNFIAYLEMDNFICRFIFIFIAYL